MVEKVGVRAFSLTAHECFCRILAHDGLDRAIVVVVIVQSGVGQKRAAFGELTRACHDGLASRCI